MKIGIITFHRADNYGAVLQNFALQAILVKKGMQVYTIDYRSAAIEEAYKLKIMSDNEESMIHRVKETLKNILRYSKLKKKKEAFKCFRDNYLILSDPFDKRSVGQIENEYDLFICGSDQIWNESIVSSEDRAVYTLGFIKGKYKASYAASAGTTSRVSDKLLSEVKLLDFITVRENTLSDFLSEEMLKQIPVVCDPVFLLDKAQWTAIAEGTHKRQYRTLFLYYIDSHRKEICQIAKYISKKKKLKIIYPTAKCRDTLFCGKCVNDDGPLDFVSDIASAEYVAAASFHAVAMAIIFHKNFIVILHEETGERVRDLLRRLGLQNRIVKGIEDFIKREDDLGDIDYGDIEKSLDSWRQFSLDVLNKMCKKE